MGFVFIVYLVFIMSKDFVASNATTVVTNRNYAINIGDRDDLIKPRDITNSETSSDLTATELKHFTNYKSSKLSKYELEQNCLKQTEEKMKPRISTINPFKIFGKDTSVDKSQELYDKTSEKPTALNNVRNNLSSGIIDNNNTLPENQNKMELPNNLLNNNEFSSKILTDNTSYIEPIMKDGKERINSRNSLSEIIEEKPIASLADLAMEADSVAPIEDIMLSQSENRRFKIIEANEPVNQTNDFIDKKSPKKDEQTLKLIDPGGESILGDENEKGTKIPKIITENILNISENKSNISIVGSGSTDTLNLTAEEVPMPVFSEWAQKQMEAEASKMQALEQEQQHVVNNSFQKRNNTLGNGKQQPLKKRSKNYASPDCGAKIIASNPDADHTGAVLTNSKDEYMLNPCGTRIWFVVELCEAIQAQKVELANFELFSSSPRNFNVAVSNRFPTRDWSNVGHFTAEDKRTVQSFELHPPYLFGKFVRVDIYSHYSKEHFCPVSFFRVFGTSELEAFETEIRASNDMDEFDDEEEQLNAKSPNNIFKSASDAVIQIVKKAAEVLVKPNIHDILKPTQLNTCFTPIFKQFSCTTCNSSLVDRINAAISCELPQLQSLLKITLLRTHIYKTDICKSDFDIHLLASLNTMESRQVLHKNRSYFLNILPIEYIGALCKLLSEHRENKVDKKYTNNTSFQKKIDNSVSSELSKEFESTINTNQERNISDIDVLKRKAEDTHFDNLDCTEAIVGDLNNNSSSITNEKVELPNNIEITFVESSIKDDYKLKPMTESIEDVNIFNVASKEFPDGINLKTNFSSPTLPIIMALETSNSIIQLQATTETNIEGEAPQITPAMRSNEEDVNNLENLDNILITNVTSTTANDGAVAAAATGTIPSNVPSTGSFNAQQKMSNGAQSESVFIRLSNRVKALERNMSLSGQYLEELSRRYKRQVEELQQTLTQQTLTLRSLEEQSRQFMEQEQIYQQHNSNLSYAVRHLTFQVKLCMGILAFVSVCIFLILILGSIYYRKLRKQTQDILLVNTAGKYKTNVFGDQKFHRRKSFENCKDRQCSYISTGKHRRPSEEALLILKGFDENIKAIKKPLQTDKSAHKATNIKTVLNKRKRKISVCNGSANNLNGNNKAAFEYDFRQENFKRSSCNISKKNQTDFKTERDLESSFNKYALISTTCQLSNVEKLANKPNQLQEQQQLFKRQESAPGVFINSIFCNTTSREYNQQVILDDNLDNFIPNSDLAYNEFMPEGPSGYQILDAFDGNIKKQEKTSKEMTRRVSSPTFFNSPFNKNKNVISNSIKAKSYSLHEPTNWEWHRLKRPINDNINYTCNNTTATTDFQVSPFLSEVELQKSFNQNSHRVIEDIVVQSTAACKEKIEEKSNRKLYTSLEANSCISSSSSGGSCSYDSNQSFGASSSTKKKNRTFNRIFRNVF